MKLLALLAAALVLAAPALASEERPTLSEIEGEVICPTCETTLDQSNSPIAERMRVFIRARIAAGDSKSEIEAALVEEFGESVLASPPKRGFNLLAWLLPLGALAAGAVVVAVAARRWTRQPQASASALDPELERRVDAELARFDG